MIGYFLLQKLYILKVSASNRAPTTGLEDLFAIEVSSAPLRKLSTASEVTKVKESKARRYYSNEERASSKIPSRLEFITKKR
jgi:hypothetical protein